MSVETSKIAKSMGESKPTAVLSFVDFWLDGYDDIFSDFDPSPYGKRTISEDFIVEVLRRFPELKEHFEIRMSVPQQLRSAKSEAVIRRRFKEYFSRMEKKVEGKIAKEKRRGGIYFAGGFFLLSLLLVLETSAETLLPVKIMSLVLAPLGWFGVWEGTRHLIEGPEEYIKKRNLYRALSEAKYEFFSEQELTGMVKEAEDAQKKEGALVAAAPQEKKNSGNKK